MKHDSWRVLTSVRAFLATYRGSTLVLFCVSGVGITLNFTLLSKSETWLQISVAAIALGAPCAAGWLSARLSHVALLPVVMLVSLYAGFAAYDWQDLWHHYDFAPLTFPLALTYVYGSFTSMAFVAGWGVRWIARKAPR